MRLSTLQKYILKECYNSKSNRLIRSILVRFYRDNSKTKKELYTKIITRSIESLIDKEFMIGYGIRTAHKWFIREISLTKKGEKICKDLFDPQQKLPFKK